ncbi:MAG TPA: TetR/AcrR family transcriptional regulator [Ktedonobacteraceae bacterium]|jgi:AcrR family transcriptional regulator|nr:TetR/AcrR family transcriptional regulator [Ktedonobacteraceae bacterium]
MGAPKASVSLKERQRREREQLILQAAEEAFRTRGYYDTSMEEIAARVGIAKGTVYLHFSCKEALVVALFTREMERLLADVEEAIAARATACERLRAVLVIMSGELRRKRAHFLASAYNGADLQRIFSAQGSQIQVLWQRLARSILGVLEQGVAAGEFRPLPPRVMLLALFSLLSSHVSERLVLEEEVSPEVFAGSIETILLHGITVEKTLS